MWTVIVISVIRLPDQQWRSVEYSRAYEILDSLYRSNGPLDVFTEFNLDYDDKTLNVAAYPLDALQNPLLASSRPSWAALLCDIHYAPFLQKRFPGLKAILLNPGLPPQDLHHSLGILLIPTAEIPAQTMDQWIQAHEVYRAVNLEVKSRTRFPHGNNLSDSSIPFGIFRKTILYWVPFIGRKRPRFKSWPVISWPPPSPIRKALQEGYPMDRLRHNMVLAQQLAGSNDRPLPDR